MATGITAVKFCNNSFQLRKHRKGNLFTKSV